MVKKNTVRLIKKYPNRRLYDTHASSYVTLTDIKTLVLECKKFAVIDAKSKEDITRTILLQIILEEESGGIPMFTELALAQIIRLYGNTMQGFMGSFLEKNVQIFSEAQEKFQNNSEKIFKNGFSSKDNKPEYFSNSTKNFQTFFGDYMENSKKIFENVEKQMQANSDTFFGHLKSSKSSPTGREK